MPFPLSNRMRARQATGAAKQNEPWLSRGFTLLELMIVMAIIMILATIVTARYKRSIDNAHEAVLKQDLWIMREAIQSYAMDKGEYPSSLDDLVTAKYIGEVPIDPMTRQKDWATKSCDEVLSVDQTSTTGICEVHSSSTGTSPSDSQPYSAW